MQKLAVHRNIWIKASPERVWLAITDPVQIQQWFSPTIPWVVSALEVGGKIYAEGYESQMGIIEVIDPPREFAYRWTSPSADDPVTTLTTFTLKEENGGTRVAISESMSGTLSEEIIKRRIEQNGHGWKMALRNMKAYMEGVALPFPDGL
jgi:uncharacterized protein YndB with AHSA1/START domain